MRVRIIDGKSGQAFPNKAITINYSWRWLDFPYPEHAWGAWRQAADQLTCHLDDIGWIQTPPHLVQPRGWYEGKYTRFPWLRQPGFTGVGISAVSESGLFPHAELKPHDLSKFDGFDLVLRVFDGWRVETTWQRKSVGRW